LESNPLQISVQADNATATGAVLISATAKDGTGIGDGGEALINANGISIDNSRVTTSTGKSFVLLAQAGRGASSGSATISAGSSKLEIKSGANDVKVSALATDKDASNGSGGDAGIYAQGIDVTVNNRGIVNIIATASNAGVSTNENLTSALATGIGNFEGGVATIDAGRQAINITGLGNASIGAVTMKATGGNSVGAQGDEDAGKASVLSNGIKIDNSAATALGTTGIEVSASAGSGESGGDAIINTTQKGDGTGQVSIKSGIDNVLIVAQAGEATVANGGNSSVSTNGIEVLAYGGAQRSGSVTVVAMASQGAGNNSSGGSALVESVGGAINISYEGSYPSAPSSGTVTVGAYSYGGFGTGEGGSSIIRTAGMSLDNTNAKSGGEINISAYSSPGDVVGSATVDSTYNASGTGVLQIKSGGYSTDRIYVSAIAEDSTKGNGANASVLTNGIDVVTGLGETAVMAIAGAGLGQDGATGGRGLIDSGAGAINISVREQTVNSGSVVLSAVGKDGVTRGGDATVHASGITLDNTNASTSGGSIIVSAQSGGSYISGAALVDVGEGDILVKSSNGTVAVLAEGGSASSGSDGAVGGSGSIKANDITINVGGTSADAKVYASGGAAALGDQVNGGDANITASGDVLITVANTIVSVDPDEDEVFLGAEAGSSSSGVGGKSSFTSKTITVENLSMLDVEIGTVGGDTTGESESSTQTPDATFITGKIDVNVNGTGKVAIAAEGGDVSKGSANAGSASFRADEINVKLGPNAKTIAPDDTLTPVGAAGGNAYDGAAGSATVVAKKITVDTSETTADGRGATVQAFAGKILDGGTGAGAGAEIRSEGDVLVKAGGGDAQVSVTASDSKDSSAAGSSAKFSAVNVNIEATKEGDAYVYISAGNATGSQTGGDAIVEITGNLNVQGASNALTSAGEAKFVALEGGSSSGSTGKNNVDVAGDVIVKTGDATTSGTKGGGVKLDLGDLTLGGKLQVITGDGSASTIGELDFSGGNITAPVIEITKQDGTLDFDIEGTLDSTTQNTAINLTGTNSGDVSINTILVGKGKRLELNNERGALNVQSLLLNPGEEATLAITNSNNLLLGSLDATKATVTFELPSGFKAGDTFITTEGNATFTDSVININDTLANLGLHDQFTLVDAGGTLTFSGTRVVTKDGDIEKVYDLVPVNGKMVTTLAEVKNPRAKIYSEIATAQLAFLTTGSDLLANAGTAQAVKAAQDAEGGALFSAFYFGKSSYETGSKVDVKSFNMMIGASYAFISELAEFTLGAFFEYGKGSYDASTNVSGSGDVHADGDLDYVGGGILTRLDFANSSEGLTYAELAARVGRNTNEISFRNMAMPGTFSYDSNYLGVNLGFGRIFNISDLSSVDLYAKYLWTRQSGEEWRLAGNEAVKFDAINSHRIRGGIRYEMQANDFISPYFGAAYEYEVDGKTRGLVSGIALDTPELKGSTGIGDIGISFDTDDSPFNLDLGLQGFVGKRKGLSGNVVLNYEY
jgi:hypothetical protein